jgi:protein-S-isoprenylcysteine O-methyltransferase Ste14
MLGFLIAFWSTPAMTWGYLMFAVMMTAYILLGISLEERDLSHTLGGVYEKYRQEVPRIVPWFRRKN